MKHLDARLGFIGRSLGWALLLFSCSMLALNWEEMFGRERSSVQDEEMMTRRSINPQWPVTEATIIYTARTGSES